MYAVTVTLEIDPEQMTAFMPLMTENARTSRKTEPGCRQFDICREGACVFLYELYDDRAAFDAHLASDHFKAFDAATAAMIRTKNMVPFAEVIR